MGHLFLAECWAMHARWCSYGCLWVRKLAKAMDKALERENDIFGTFIYKNNGN